MDSLSSMHIPYRFILEYLDCMQGTSPKCSSVDKLALNPNLLLPDSVMLKQVPEGGLWHKGMWPETLSTAPPPVFKTYYISISSMLAKGLLQRYEQDLILNWSNSYCKHAMPPSMLNLVKFFSIYGRLKLH